MDTVRTARITGLWYLALGLTGMAAFLLVRPRLRVDGDPAATAAVLVEQAGLVRLGLVLNMALVISQVVAALWFHRLMRALDRFDAVAVAVFGCFNAVAILAGATFLWTALRVAGDPGGDVAATTQLLHRLSDDAWGLGALFFGLWLIPMGHVVVTSRRWPAPLGWVLMVGGVGYLVSAFVAVALPDAPAGLVQGVTVPATVGELWMIGYLLSFGIRPAGGTAPRPHDEALLAPA